MTEIGPYRVFGELGRGRHAIIYKAVHRNSAQPVALKVLRHYDQATLDKFEREALLSERLHLPGVRRTYEAGKTREGFIFLAMEYVDASLKDVMQRQGRPFTREEAARLLEPVAQALDQIHRQGMVHLDIKPENILVFDDGRAVLADFGITRQQGETTTEGTPRYMSPEQAAGDRPVSPQSDVYALAVVIYEMLAGQPPFRSESDVVLLRQHIEDAPPTPRALNPQIDRATARAVLAALSKDPRARPAGAVAFLQALQAAHSTPILLVKDVMRERPQAVLIPAGVLVLALFGWLVMSPSRSPASLPTPTPTSTSVAQATEKPAVAPTLTPTPPAKLPPTATPRPVHTPTPAPPTFTPIPPTPAAPPRLLSPQDGSNVSVEMVTFSWEGQLNRDQTFVVHVYHRATREPATCTFTGSHTCQAKIPLKAEGEWRWSVAIEPNGLRSDESHFWRVY